MKLWILRPVKDWAPWYDRCFGVVVRASTEDDARELASTVAGDEGGAAWKKPSKTSCASLSEEGEAAVIIRDLASA